MAPRDSKPDWQIDPKSGRKVRWSTSKSAWVDKDGTIVSTSRELRATASSSRQPVPSQESRRPPYTAAAGGNDGGLSRSLRGMSISSPSQPSSARDARTSTTYSGQDPASKAETLWDFEVLGSIEDPYEKTRHEINLKRVRESNANTHTRPQGYSVQKEDELQPGCVIEVLLVPPQHAAPSNVSRITPTGVYASPGLQRLRRFVIILTRPNGRPVFHALAIKTYTGMGVALPGVIKFHHSIIYTNRLFEADAERPSIGYNSQKYRMQPSPIRVVNRDRMQALDPMARLDYTDMYELDLDFPHIRIFGVVHPDSREAFRTQYRNVWETIRGSASGDTARGSLDQLGQEEASEVETVRAGPSSIATAQTTYPIYSRDSMKYLTPYDAADSGQISVAQMQAVINAYASFAGRKGYTMPEDKLTSQQQIALAANSARRATYLARIRDRWKGEMKEAQRTDSDDEGEDVASEDNDTESDDDEDDDDEDDGNDRGTSNQFLARYQSTVRRK